jgi:hypothetical protein
MNLDDAIALLESQGYSVKKQKQMTVDASFMGVETTKTIHLDSASQTPHMDELERLRLDALEARNQMIKKLDPSVKTRSENDSQKSTQALGDIAKAAFDSYCDRLEGYTA